MSGVTIPGDRCLSIILHEAKSKDRMIAPHDQNPEVCDAT